MARVHAPSFAAITLLLVLPAYAQRAEDNAVTSASDAFGTVVGNQTIGLYSPTNARGFNPTQAQNIRIEGLYFDQQTTGTDPFLFKGSDMRVGIAAQSYAFPSPSGIADLNIRTPGDGTNASAVLGHGPLKQYSAELDTQFPVRKDSLNIGLNVGADRDFDYDYALKSARQAISVVARIRPNQATEVIPFVGYIHNDERYETPLVYADRVHPLPLFDEQHLPTQAWTTWRWNQTTAGIIAKSAISAKWIVRVGLFRSVQANGQNFSDLLLGLRGEGVADHIVDVAPPHTASSYSGDVRLTRTNSGDAHRRELSLDVRGRHATREFGGDSVFDLGTLSIHENAVIAQPTLMFSASSHDRVQQTALGIDYREIWKDRVSLTVGALWTDYSRRLETPDQPPAKEHTGKLLPTVSIVSNALRPVTVYGSYTRGLEDSAIAPNESVNRGEPPPATPTWQVDGGLRVTMQPYLQFLLGAFKIHKVYFNLDTTSRYKQVGDISSQGIESSATVTGPDGLTVIAGGVWLRPEVRRQLLELGGNGSVPVGPVPRTLNINIDYAPSAWKGWGTSLQWKSLSARVETGDDLYRLPPLNTLNVGVRYLFKLYKSSLSARLDVANVTDATGLTITSTYGVVPQLRRNYTFTFAADI